MGIFKKARVWMSDPANAAMLRQMGMGFSEAAMDPYGTGRIGSILAQGGQARAEEKTRQEQLDEDRKRAAREELQDKRRQELADREAAEFNLNRMEKMVGVTRRTKAFDASIGEIEDKDIRKALESGRGTEDTERTLLGLLASQADRRLAKADAEGEKVVAAQEAERLRSQLPASLRQRASMVPDSEVPRFVTNYLSTLSEAEIRERFEDDDADKGDSIGERLNLYEQFQRLAKPSGKTKEELLEEIEMRGTSGDREYTKIDEQGSSQQLKDIQRVLSGEDPRLADEELDRLEAANRASIHLPELGLGDVKPAISEHLTRKYRVPQSMGTDEEERELVKLISEYEDLHGREAAETEYRLINENRKLGRPLSGLIEVLRKKLVPEVRVGRPMGGR